jgi:hypothetical protein
VIARRRCRSELPNKKNQWNSRQHEPCQRRKAIKEREEGCLPFQKVKRLRLGVNNRIWMGETVRREVAGEVVEKLPIALIEWSRVGHKHALMILGPSR